MSVRNRANGSRLRGNRGRSGGEVHEFAKGDAVVRLSHWPSFGVSGGTVLLVHGIGMGQQYFGLLREALRDSFDVVAVDLPGFGDSPTPAHARAHSMAATAQLLALAIQDAGLRDVVAVGHSMGTQVVAELAASHPELVKLLVLIAPTVNREERSMPAQALRLVQDLLNDPPIVGIVGAAMYVKTGPRWFLAKFRSMLRHRIEWVAPRITQPTLVVRGAEDLVCPREWVQFVASLIPDARYREAPGKGHEAMITGAEPVSDMIEEFVAAHP